MGSLHEYDLEDFYDAIEEAEELSHEELKHKYVIQKMHGIRDSCISEACYTMAWIHIFIMENEYEATLKEQERYQQYCWDCMMCDHEAMEEYSESYRDDGISFRWRQDG